MKKLMITFKTFLFILLAIIGTAMTAAQANASVLGFNMDFEYSGGTDPQGSRPWAAATFVDRSPNNVTLTMSGAGLVNNEFISVWLFNFDPALNSSLLSFSLNGSPGSVPTISTGNNAFKAGPEKFFDIEFSFPTKKAGRFTAGETVVLDISYNGPEQINVFSFSADGASGTHGPYNSAMHIQGIDSGKSGWVGTTTVVPEPVSSVLFLSGGAALGFRRYWKKKT